MARIGCLLFAAIVANWDSSLPHLLHLPFKLGSGVRFHYNELVPSTTSVKAACFSSCFFEGW
jgi:hypothetical protein